MTREIELNGIKINYEFQYKNVKNINIRINPDMTVHVSSGRKVPVEVTEEFLKAKADFIIRALKKFSERKVLQKVRYRTEEELKALIAELCRDAWKTYEKTIIIYPEIKFRKMVSRWGSCHPLKKVLTFNTNLVYAPYECVCYVVWHEFTHFIQANHSQKFYEELEKVFPDWKRCRNLLKDICIRN